MRFRSRSRRRFSSRISSGASERSAARGRSRSSAVWPAYTLANARYPALEPGRVRALRAESRLVDFLRREKAAYVVGDYWDVYGINFLSEEKILAVPAYGDYEDYGALLPGELLFALVAWEPGLVSEWARSAAIAGRVVPFGEGLEAYLPLPNPPWPEKPRAVAWFLNRRLLALRPPSGREPIKPRPGGPSPRSAPSPSAGTSRRATETRCSIDSTR